MTTAPLSAPSARPERALASLPEIRHHLRTSRQPVFYVSRTATNLLGIDRWVRGFSFITLVDSWDGAHPRVFTPGIPQDEAPAGGMQVVNWLLRNADVQQHIAERTPEGMRPQIVIAFFNEETEEICAELGYDLCMPSVALRKHVDSKIITTQLGNEAGAPSVPNILTVVESWEDLLAKADAAGLGRDLVVQSEYGDSGRTTFFVTEQPHYDAIADWIHGREVKVMRRINHRPLAAEVTLTSSGPVIGPCLNEITGHPELTSYRGGWAGSELGPNVLEGDTLHSARELIRRFSERLGEEGYRGVLEVSVLLDTDTGEVYLGELNPRISGSSSLSTMTAAAYADLPLFALHILEFAGVPFAFDSGEVNDRWAKLAATDVWSTLIIKHVGGETERITEAPRSGRYDVDAEGELSFAAVETDWLQLRDESDAYFLRFLGPGDRRERDDDLGILVTRRTLLENGELTPVAKRLITSIRGHYSGIPAI